MRSAQIVLLVLAGASLLAGCATKAWDGSVDRWGTLRQVLREGDDHGKVHFARICSPFTHGIGALAKLEGEIAIQRGVPFTSRASSPSGLPAHARIRSSIATRDDEAAFLVSAEVYTWSEFRIEKTLDEEGFRAWLEIELAGTAAEHAAIVPVRITGIFRWNGHVLAGHCPFSTEPMRPGASSPVPVTGSLQTGATLIGFFTRLPPGEIAHHGTSFHLHAVDQETGQVAHVDSFTLGLGSRVHLPAIDGLDSSSTE